MYRITSDGILGRPSDVILGGIPDEISTETFDRILVKLQVETSLEELLIKSLEKILLESLGKLVL